MCKIVTRNDVAELANVSPTIVSYVLNNSNYVSQEKREAVLKAVEKLGYVPNQLAKALRTNKSSHFAFICDNIQGELFLEVEKLLFKRGYYVSLNYSRPTDDFVRMLISRQLEGIFMISNSFSTKQLNTIVSSGIPLILYKTRNYDNLDPRIVTVAPDYYDGVKRAVDYLAFKKHRNIALIPPVKYITKGIEGNDFRVNAYIEALTSNGLPIKEHLVCTATQSVEEIYESIFSMMVEYPQEDRPTALVVGHDYLAAQIMQYLRKLNIKIPEEVSIIGCDNTQIAPIVLPSLTTVDFSQQDLAEKHVEKMFALIGGDEVEDEYINVRLVIRGSA